MHPQNYASALTNQRGNSTLSSNGTGVNSPSQMKKNMRNNTNEQRSPSTQKETNFGRTGTNSENK
eukprot:UN33681